MSESLLTILPPDAMPTTVDRVKEQMRITGDDDSQDGMIERLIGAAVGMVERDTRRVLVTRTMRLALDDFPRKPPGVVHLPAVPVASIVSVKYLHAETGIQQTLSAASYRLDAAHEPGRLEPAHGETWPAVRKMLGSVTVDFVAGAAADELPEDLVHAIIMIAAHLYENAEATTTLDLKAVPMAVETILARYRRPTL
ncbi:MAG: head-tail connector protein [Planctomycetota bacterium]